MTHSATSGHWDQSPSCGSAGGQSGSSPPKQEPALGAVRLLLFASARQAAGARQVDMTATTVGEVLDEACRRFGAEFAAVLDASRVWVNGEPAPPATRLFDGDEVAVLPPVSGG